MTPDRDTIYEFLCALFEGEAGFIEIAWTPVGGSNPSEAARKPANDLNYAADVVVRLNGAGRNVYVGPALRAGEDAGRAKDADATQTRVLWVDFDEPGAAEAAREKCAAAGIAPQIIATTGVTPHLRQHFYWRVETHDAQSATDGRRRLAMALGGDPSVHNPSRIMRVPGTVAWPTKPGRVAELTTAEFSLGEADLDALRRYVSSQPTTDTASAPITAAADYHSPVTLDFLSQIREPGNWHRTVCALVGRLVEMGWTDKQVLGLAPVLTTAGYTPGDTASDIGKMLYGARQKWGSPSPAEPTPLTPEGEADHAVLLPILEATEALRLTPPDWLVHGWLQERGLGVIYAPFGVGKTFVALDIALHVATGRPWHGHEVTRGNVVYVYSEGAASISNRLGAWAASYPQAWAAADGAFAAIPTNAYIQDEAQRKALIDVLKDRDAKLLVIDTVANNFQGQENDGEKMNEFIAAARTIQGEVGCAVLFVHHTGKNVALGMRGSTVFGGAMDAIIRLDQGEGETLRENQEHKRFRIECEKQKDAEAPKPMTAHMDVVEFTHPVTGSLQSSLVVGALTFEKRAPMTTGERAIWDAVVENGPIGTNALARILDRNPPNVSRSLSAMIDKRWVIKTPDGKYQICPQDQGISLSRLQA